MLCVAAVEMAASEPVAGTDGHWRLPRLLHWFYRSSVQAFRRSDHVYIVPRRRVDAYTQDAYTSADRVQSYSRCVMYENDLYVRLKLRFTVDCCRI